jgi:hypothetical protein
LGSVEEVASITGGFGTEGEAKRSSATSISVGPLASDMKIKFYFVKEVKVQKDVAGVLQMLAQRGCWRTEDHGGAVCGVSHCHDRSAI